MMFNEPWLPCEVQVFRISSDSFAVVSDHVKKCTVTVICASSWKRTSCKIGDIVTAGCEVAMGERSGGVSHSAGQGYTNFPVCDTANSLTHVLSIISRRSCLPIGQNPWKIVTETWPQKTARMDEIDRVLEFVVYHTPERFKSCANATLTYRHLSSWCGELVSKQFLIYTWGSYRATRSSSWSHVSGHLINVNPIFTFLSLLNAFSLKTVAGCSRKQWARSAMKAAEEPQVWVTIFCRLIITSKPL